MKRGDISNWSNISECQNLLFFAQLVVELLFDYSALFKKFCKRDFCDEVRDFKIPEPEAVAS